MISTKHVCACIDNKSEVYEQHHIASLVACVNATYTTSKVEKLWWVGVYYSPN
jgi:hypothetical protein